MTLDQPNLEAVRILGREGFRLTDPWSYEWAVGSHRIRRLTVPAGFIHDGASVPRILWTILGLTPAGLISAAALMHDACYRCGGKFPPGWLFERDVEEGAAWRDLFEYRRGLYTRKTADRFFYRLMREVGVPRVRRRMAYWGVRLCGWHAWAR